MVTAKKLFVLQLFSHLLVLCTAQWCVKYDRTDKTRIQWNNGQRMVSKRNFFGGIKYKYEPYVYSSVQYYTDYERVNVCCDGYRKISDIQCDPICEPSCPTNTHCSRPNICECNYGYRGYTSIATLIRCYPDCKPSCSANAECTDVNKCTCKEGFKEDEKKGTCEAVCDKICPENSKCLKPNECLCDRGYLDNGVGKCEAVCVEKCPEHSQCTKPEICTCEEGYEMLEEKCQPLCEEKCPENSECSKPNLCECLKGYQKMEQENSTFQCLPKCDQECPLNSECRKPNECDCREGYTKNALGLCEAKCDTECPEHSECSEPNLCSCLKGYEMLNNQCQPICDKPCPENSSCSKPNYCKCETGYQQKLSSIYNLYCEPICQSNCSAFGECIQPNKCECIKGYEMDELEVCQPICSKGCQNGLCFLTDVCICNPGYLMGPRDQCEPACSRHCENASCVEPEICQCHEGFQFTKGSINVCEPICEPKCINGICVGPNICICHEDYEPVETELGLNHSNCQVRHTPTTELYSTTSDMIASTTEPEIEIPKELDNYEKSLITESPKNTQQPDQLLSTTISTDFASADYCSDICQCWHEYDEFGPLVSTECTHICLDSHDRPCLNLTLCQCDVAKTHLICRASEDSVEQEDPLLFMCKIQRIRGASSKSVDVKPITDSNTSNLPLIIGTSIGVLVVATILGGLLYVRFMKVEDQILEYEL